MAEDSVTSAINKVKAKSVLQKLLGWIITVFDGLMVLVGLSMTSDATDVALVLFFAGITALGVLMIIKGNKKAKLIKTFYDYSARLATDPEKSIDLLASSTGVTVAVARKNISDMIALGFFPNCYLDGQCNKLVFPNEPAMPTPVAPVKDPVAFNQTVKYVTVKCNGCGATNKIIAGTVGECEFCGSKISE